MAQDLTLPVGDGYLNVRVGAIIQKNGKLLMVASSCGDYYYSVGGRIQFGESAEEAIRREVLEETGWALEIERLGFIHEDFFLCDAPSKWLKPMYEIAFYFYMKTPPDFEPLCEKLDGEGLEWVSPDTEKAIYPTFFRTELHKPCAGVRHIVTDERGSGH